MTGMLIRQAGGKWQPPATTAYEDEKELKLLLKHVPGLLWEATAVVDEFYIPGAGSVDLLGVGVDGSITLVECKLENNSEIRRKVVGQILAYAGGLWRTPYDDFAVRYAKRAGTSLTEHVAAAVGSPLEDEAAFRAAVHASLQSGAFRLVIAVDHITEELKFVVEWLNGHTAAGVEVLALEADYAKDDGIEVLVPRFYGETAVRNPAAVIKQSEADMVMAIESLEDPAVRAVFERLLAHGHEFGDHSEPGTAGMSYWYAIDGMPASVWAMWPNQKPAPVISVSIGSINNKSPARAAAFVERLKSNAVLAPYLAQVDAANMKRYPTIPISGVLTQPGVLECLLGAIEETLLG